MVLFLIMVVMSVVAFVAMGVDKRRAKMGKWRISERMLLLLALLFGAPGAYCGMRAFRHKLRKHKFSIGLPVLFAVEVIFVGWFMFSSRPSGV